MFYYFFKFSEDTLVNVCVYVCISLCTVSMIQALFIDSLLFTFNCKLFSLANYLLLLLWVISLNIIQNLTTCNVNFVSYNIKTESVYSFQPYLKCVCSFKSVLISTKIMFKIRTKIRMIFYSKVLIIYYFGLYYHLKYKNNVTKI